MPKNPRIDDDDLDEINLDDDVSSKEFDDEENNSRNIENKKPIEDNLFGKNLERESHPVNKQKKKKLNYTHDDLDNPQIKSKEQLGEQISEDSNHKRSDLLSAEGDEEETKFFVIRVSGGQESYIASMLQSKLSSKKINGIFSILFLDNFKGYVIVEAIDSNVVYDALHGVRHLRGQIRGELPFKDLEGFLIKKPVVTELNIDDTVEIIGGPFKSMKAKIMRVDYEKHEATVVLLDSPYQIPVTVDANYLKKSL